MRKIEPIRLRSYLGCFVAAVLLPIVGLSAYLGLRSAQNTRLSLEGGMRNVAHALSLAVDGQVSAAKSSLDALAASSSLRAGDYAAFRREAEAFLKNHEGWLSIVDESGQQHLNTRLAPDALLPRTDNRDWLGHVFGGDRYFVTGAITGPVVKDPFVAISRTTKTDDGTPLALTLSLAPVTLTRLLLEQQFPAKWYGVIADREGIIIGRTQSSALIGRPMTIRLTPPAGFSRARTWEGERVYIAWTSSAMTGWATGVAAPALYFDNLIFDAWLRSAILAALALALALAAAFLVGRLLTRPLDALMSEIRRGGAPMPSRTRAPVTELNDVAAAFRAKVAELVEAGAARDKAQAELEELNKALEKRVQARTEEIEQLGQRLFQLQKQESIGRLAGGIAHDFNNLLTAVIGNLEFVAMRLGEHPVLRFIRNAETAARRGAELTAQLLAFSRRQNLDPKPVDVNAAVGGMVEMLRSTLGRTIRIETRLADGQLSALADGTQLDLMLLNLAINARDAMPEGGEIVIETRAETVKLREGAPETPLPGDYAVISVKDTGTGMSDEVRARAFEPYFTTKPLGEGSGLGLPHVLGVTKQLGGGLRLRSKQGQGTSVEIFLPICSQMEEKPPTPEREPAGVPERKARVLLVDDDADVRLVAASMLEELGCSVVEAGGGAAAIELVRKQRLPFEAALIDYAMPGMNGAEAAREIGHSSPATSILIVTGYADADRLKEGWHGPVLKKPFDLAQMAEALRGLLARPANVIPMKHRADAS